MTSEKLLSNGTVLLAQVGASSSVLLDKLFGKRLLTGRAAAISTCFSFASFTCSVAIFSDVRVWGALVLVLLALLPAFHWRLRVITTIAAIYLIVASLLLLDPGIEIPGQVPTWLLLNHILGPLFKLFGAEYPWGYALLVRWYATAPMVWLWGTEGEIDIGIPTLILYSMLAALPVSALSAISQSSLLDDGCSASWADFRRVLRFWGFSQSAQD